MIPCSLAFEGVVEEGCYLNKCLFYLKQLNCSLGVQYGHSQSSRQNKLRHHLALYFKVLQPNMRCIQMKLEGLRPRSAAVGKNHKKCSRWQPWQLRRAVTSLPQSEQSFPSPWNKDVFSSTPYTIAGFSEQQCSLFSVSR